MTPPTRSDDWVVDLFENVTVPDHLLSGGLLYLTGGVMTPPYKAIWLQGSADFFGGLRQQNPFVQTCRT